MDKERFFMLLETNGGSDPRFYKMRTPIRRVGYFGYDTDWNGDNDMDGGDGMIGEADEDPKPTQKAPAPQAKTVSPPQAKSAAPQKPVSNDGIDKLKQKNDETLGYITQILKMMPTMKDIREIEKQVYQLKDEMQKVSKEVKQVAEPTEEERKERQKSVSNVYTKPVDEYWNEYYDRVDQEYPNSNEYLGNLSGNNFRAYLKKRL
jgi:hypothetical protein